MAKPRLEGIIVPELLYKIQQVYKKTKYYTLHEKKMKFINFINFCHCTLGFNSETKVTDLIR